MPCAAAPHGLLPREHPFTVDPDLAQGAGRALAACAVVVHNEHRQIHELPLLPELVPLELEEDRHRDLRALVRRALDLDRAVHEIHEHLLDPQAVAADSLVLDVVDVHLEVVPVRVDAWPREREQVVDQLGQAEVLLCQRDLPALDAGHVQHLVDEAEQVATGLRDLSQALDDLDLAVDVRPRDRREADDRVHRRADVVRHV